MRNQRVKTPSMVGQNLSELPDNILVDTEEFLDNSFVHQPTVYGSNGLKISKSGGPTAIVTKTIKSSNGKPYKWHR